MMRTKLLTITLCGIIFTASWAEGTTYYVRTDGGTGTECSGLVNAPYPGTGSSGDCAWSHPFWALDSGGDWILQAGDTLLIGSGSFEMGYGAPNTGWCDADGAFECRLPPLPSGSDPIHPTIISGSCSNPPELWGTQRPWSILSLESTSNAVLSCLEITDHSGCVEFHTDPAVSCERDAYPFGDWAPEGIYASDSSNVILKDLNIHGLAATGIHAGRIRDWTVERVRIAGNGFAGWDGDLWDGDSDSNSGTLIFRDFTVEWNGCAETYPGEGHDHCWEQETGGYGDGVGTGATGGHWIFEDSYFGYNTSDGLDLLYVGREGEENSFVEVRRTVAVGNLGNQVKIGGASLVENNVLVGNCGYLFGKPYSQEILTWCRAGGNTLALSLQAGDASSVVNNTIAGQGDVLLEVQCDEALENCDGSETVTVINNIFAGYDEFTPYPTGEQTGLLWDPDGFTEGRIDFNLIFNVKDETEWCPMGVHDLCLDPLVSDGDIDRYDGHLLPESPAIDAGTFNGAPDDDVEGNMRPIGAGIDMGAYEYGTASRRHSRPFGGP